MNQFNKFKDFVHGNLSNKNDRQILSPVVEKEEKHMDNIKTILTTAEKKLNNSLLSGTKGSEPEKKQKKLPSASLHKFFNEASDLLSKSKNDSVLSKTLLACSQLQNEFTQIIAEHESNVEEQCLDEIKKYLNEDLPSIQRTKKQLNKANEDLKQAKNKYESFSKTISNSTQMNSEMIKNKLESLKKEVEHCETRLEQCRDAYEIEMFDFLGKELPIAEIFYKYTKILQSHHDNMSKQLHHYIPVLEGLLNNSSQKPVFGVPLEDHLLATGKKISVVIEKCVEFLCPFVKEEGLFRISGSISKVKRMRNAFNSGRLEVLNDLKNDAAAVVSTLKSYLRELPEPLLTFKLNQNWFEASQEKDLDKRLKAIWTVCDMLPEANKNNLCYLLRFLNELTKHKELNKMSSQNLAIALGPSLLWSKGDTYDLSMSNHLPTLVEALITYCDYFFPGDYLSEPINYNSDGEILSTPTTPNQTHKMINSASNLSNQKKKPPAPKPPGSPLPVPSSALQHTTTNKDSPSIGSQSSRTTSKFKATIDSFKNKVKTNNIDNVKNKFSVEQPQPPQAKSPSPSGTRDDEPQIRLSMTNSSLAPSGSTAVYLRKQSPIPETPLNHGGKNRPKSICERPSVAPPSIPARPSVAPKPENRRTSPQPSNLVNNDHKDKNNVINHKELRNVLDRYSELNHIDSESEESNSFKEPNIDENSPQKSQQQETRKALIEFESNSPVDSQAFYPSLDGVEDSDDPSIMTPPPPRKPPRAHSSTNSSVSSSSNLSLDESTPASPNNNNNDVDSSKFESNSGNLSGFSSPKSDIKESGSKTPEELSSSLSTSNQTYL